MSGYIIILICIGIYIVIGIVSYGIFMSGYEKRELKKKQKEEAARIAAEKAKQERIEQQHREAEELRKKRRAEEEARLEAIMKQREEESKKYEEELNRQRIMWDNSTRPDKYIVKRVFRDWKNGRKYGVFCDIKTQEETVCSISEEEYNEYTSLFY